jgi:hypothetical protein
LLEPHLVGIALMVTGCLYFAVKPIGRIFMFIVVRGPKTNSSFYFYFFLFYHLSYFNLYNFTDLRCVPAPTGVKTHMVKAQLAKKKKKKRLNVESVFC